MSSLDFFFLSLSGSENLVHIIETIPSLSKKNAQKPEMSADEKLENSVC